MSSYCVRGSPPHLIEPGYLKTYSLQSTKGSEVKPQNQKPMFSPDNTSLLTYLPATQTYTIDGNTNTERKNHIQQKEEEQASKTLIKTSPCNQPFLLTYC